MKITKKKEHYLKSSLRSSSYDETNCPVPWEERLLVQEEIEEEGEQTRILLGRGVRIEYGGDWIKIHFPDGIVEAEFLD